MKRITQTILCIALFITLITGCKKDSTAPAPAPPVATPSKPMQVDNDGRISGIVYNNDGSIQSITTSDPSTATVVYQFSYQNGKLKEVNYGGRWVYTYTGNHLTSVETFNAGGQLRYTYEFSYTGDKVAACIEYKSVVNKNPQFKTHYTYLADGNIARAERFQYTNNVWGKTEEIVYQDYDQHENIADVLASFPYLPGSMFSPNNAGKEIWMSDGLVDMVVTHAYTYDTNGKMLTRKSTHKITGFPESFSEMKVTY